ncbi:helix-turn-helix domain-containing protein [Caldimonas thermodepolymerans]|uniref:DNA-3-methyladenine glycosylase II n=1 Tax=Caldimonas thermodepolymerans TaxID=215580 RepID=A0A2S5T1P2_9BURK|nr:Ada metal-binding domain-containing protein [Caldimonas thermodepolymerans]PPE68862.1 adenosine deaminase [Caldimonas thermodepolymerans]QPC30438.1 helix-turn-helix domain-containing protein [Caldimonas thermodepolymerans]RDI02982.1 DNA-3-methyladenine glycosylase II [Caldimonas thermodepolymerans]
MLDADAAYLALKARDARFDGMLFVGVTSTGVYCRPICRVRTPRRENCRFFASAAQAEAARFRPCLKCRPEIAPGRTEPWTVMDASRTLAQQAAHWLDQHAASGGKASVETLARTLGITDRHLRRIFVAEHGVTPLQYLLTRRLLLAKQLLTDTDLPVTQVALAAGFTSLRRFNAAFVERYRLNPSTLRRRSGPRASSADALTLHLAFREPYDRGAMLRFLSQRAIPGVESVGDTTIRRSLRLRCDDRELHGWLQVQFVAQRPLVRVDLAPQFAPASATLIRAVRRWLDLDAVPDAIDLALRDLPGSGIRLPGALDAFELAVRAVLGQQVTVAAARTLATRLAQAWGEPVATPWAAEVSRLFPAARQLAALQPADLGALGIVRQRAAAIIALARQWDALQARLHAGEPASALIAALEAVPGIGPWTAHYIAMRALAWPDAFPPGDVAVLKAMNCSAREAEARAQAWRPWRSYAVLRLWHALAQPISLGSPSR